MYKQRNLLCHSAWGCLLVSCLATVIFSARQVQSRPIPLTSPVLKPGEHCCPIDTTRLWSKSLHGLDPAVARHVQPLFAYQFLLPQLQLRDGLEYLGSAIRLRRFVSDLLEGTRPLKVGIVGGSISWGEGASTRGTTDWFSVFMKWMESVSKQVYGRNGCVPASPASYMVVCLEQHVDPDVDIVFVEYVFNDGIENTLVENHVVLAMEQLVRRLLALPGRPAVVLVQVPHVRNTDVLPFYETSEDLEGALAAYYGLSSVSLRNALFQFNSIRPTQGFLWNQTYFHHHPGDNGHKMISDLVVNLIQEVAVGLATSPVREAELTEREQPLAPVPMYAGNFPPESASCIAGDALKAQVVSVEGWQWVNEGTDEKPKWGFVSETPGSTLLVRLNTTQKTSHDDATLANLSMPVIIQFLRSYTRVMGVANVHCLAGCTCNVQRIQSFHTRHASETAMHGMAVYLLPNNTACDLMFNVSTERVSRGGHKFKVIGVVTTALGYGFASAYGTGSWHIPEDA